MSFAQDTFSVFYQEKPYFTGNKVKILTPKFEGFNKKLALFIVSIYQKALAHLTWGVGSTTESIQGIKIKLPINKDGTIAFEFMENYIRELEAERIRELEVYLEVTGLKDYKLNAQEREALAIFASSLRESTQKHPHCHTERSEVSQKNSDRDISAFAKPQYDNYSLHWREFKIGELFSVKSNPQLNKDSFEFAENGEYPYFTRTCLNNGINGYVNYLDEEHKIKGNGLAVGMLGMQFFYMQKDFYAGQFTKTCYPKFERFNQKIAHFFIAYLNKQQSQFQAVLVRDFEKTFNETKILLPINQNNQIAFEFMETFIKAIEKEVIKSVVLWSEKRLNATKAIVENHH